LHTSDNYFGTLTGLIYPNVKNLNDSEYLKIKLDKRVLYSLILYIRH